MDWKTLINEGAIGLALIIAVVALVIIVVVDGSMSVAPTGLRDLIILLGGALAGTKIPKS